MLSEQFLRANSLKYITVFANPSTKSKKGYNAPCANRVYFLFFIFYGFMLTKKSKLDDNHNERRVFSLPISSKAYNTGP